MDPTKPVAEVVEDRVDDVHRGEEVFSAHQDVPPTPTPATRKPAGYIAALLVADPDSVYQWAHGTPPVED